MATRTVGDKHSVARAVAALTLLLVFLAVPALVLRAGVDKASPVALLVDGEEIEVFTYASGAGRDEVLARLKNAGAVGVGLHELTLDDLVSRRPFFAATKASLAAVGAPVAVHLPESLPDRARLFGWSGPIEPWLEASLQAHLPSVGERIDAPGYDGALWLLDSQVPLNAVGVGFDLEEAAAIRRAGLEVVLRPRDDPRSPGAVAFILGQIEAVEPLAVVFWGSSVLGYPGLLETVGEAVRAAGVPVGLIEFSVQRGVEHLARLTGYRVLRVHSIAPHEPQADFDREAALDRWLRAARERRNTLLYVRVPPPGRTDMELTADLPAGEAIARFDAYLAYLSELARRLQAAGFVLGAPATLPGLPVHWTGLVAAVIGVAAAGGLLGSQLWGRRASWAWLAAVGCVAAFWLLWLKGYTILARQAAAFGAALVFPVLSVWTANRSAAGWAERRPRAGFRAGLVAFGLGALVTLVGAAFLVVLLSDVRFLVKVEEFRGVKAAHLVPPFLLAGLLIRPAPGGSWREWLRSPLRLRHVLLALAGVAVLLVYLLRTGNDGLPVPAMEDAFRRTLEKVFLARPRTKEFLLGHPALLAGLALRARGESRLAPVLLVIGSVGQVSMLNTFAHAHTPLLLSVLRTVYGLLLGLLVGTACFFILEWARAAARPRIPAAGRVSE